MTLTWNASSDNVGVTGYDVYRNGTKMATVTSTTASQTGLACATSYTFGVVARDAAGNSSPQAQLSASTSACPPPPAPPPPPPPATGACSQTISSGLASAIQSASAGATICLAPGSYRNVADLGLQGERRDDPARLGSYGDDRSCNFNNVNHLHFTGTGGSMSIGGLHMDITSGTSNNLTFDHVAWTAALTVDRRGLTRRSCSTATCSITSGREIEGRFNVRGFSNSSPFGLTISNSHFGSGGCSDGIQFVGSSYGAVVGPGNEFEGIMQGGCDPAHVDPIRVYGCDHVVITGNWIHDNDTAIMSGDNSCNAVTVSNNVIKSLGASQAIYCGACENWVVEA